MNAAGTSKRVKCRTFRHKCMTLLTQNTVRIAVLFAGRMSRVRHHEAIPLDIAGYLPYRFRILDRICVDWSDESP